MKKYQEIEGDLISLTLQEKFDVIAHGLNCFNTQKSGIAAGMVKQFITDSYPMEKPQFKGDINKLGTIDFQPYTSTGDSFRKSNPNDLHVGDVSFYVVNCYTQYRYGTNHPDGVYKPVDYDAIRLVMRKMNRIFKHKHIGLPLIGCGLAGGDWTIVKQIIQEELTDMYITIVKYKK